MVENTVNNSDANCHAPSESGDISNTSARDTSPLKGQDANPLFETVREDLQSRSRSDLIPALCVLISCAERTIGPPLGKNVRLVGSLRRLNALLGRLDHLTDDEFMGGIENLATVLCRPAKSKQDQDSVSSLKNLSLREVERLLANPTITKKQLLSIVKERFGGSTGTLGRLGQKALLERVATLVMNERSHETVARLATASANPSSVEGNTSKDDDARSAHDKSVADAVE